MAKNDRNNFIVSVAKTARLKASVAAKSLIASIGRVASLKALAEIGFFLRIIVFRDRGSAGDSHSLEPQKPFSDSSNFTDEEIKTFGKVATESPSVTDADVKDLGKLVTDTSILTDATALSSTKSQSDSGSITDNQIILTGLVKSDASSIADSEIKTVAKVASDSGAFTDQHFSSVAKAFIDSSALTDFTTFSGSKTISDALSVTDDSNGAAIGDDQTIQAFKPIEENPSALDVVGKLFITSFADAVVTSDSAIVSNIVENDASDSFGMTDLLSFNLGKGATDGLAAGEVFEFVVGKLIADDPVFADETALSFARPSLQDTGNFSDSAVKLVDVNTSDSGDFADSGSLRSQGYCDFTYFADNYVGTSRTF